MLQIQKIQIQKIKEIKVALDVIEGELLKPEREYSWADIEQTFKFELPMLSADAVEKFQKRLDGADLLSPSPVSSVSSVSSVSPEDPKRIGYGRRKLPSGVPTALEMTDPIVDYLAKCKNMTASKTAIFNAIKNTYPKKIREIPHRTKGEDSARSLIEYRVEWACSILIRNGKALGHSQDASVPKKHVKLLDVNKFTEAETTYLKANGYSLKGLS